jgi:hypothetical protein
LAIHRHFIRNVAIALAIATAVPAFAQEAPSPEKIQQLEQKLDELLRQAAEIREQLNQLKPPAPAPSDDLLNVEVAPAPASPEAPVAPATPDGAIADVQTVENRSDPSTAKVFNPDIAAIGTFLSHAGQDNPYEFGSDAKRAPFSMEEAELSLEAFIDPYAKGKFFISVSPEGVELEEGFAQFLSLPYGLTAKAGKTKATFGKANTWHTHARPWADQPLVIHNFFGDEGMSDAGLSVSKLFTNDFAVVEATGEVYSGDVDGVFARTNQNDLFYNAHLKAFRDLSENSNVELGGSYARGSLPDAGGSNQFTGVDLTYRWKPLQRSDRSFIGRVEAITNDREDTDRQLFGFYASGDYKFAQRWIAGLRVDRADRAHPLTDDAVPGRRFTDRGASATLTFWPSEFSQLRGQLRRISYGGLEPVTEFLLQLQFSIGAHGAHTF